MDDQMPLQQTDQMDTEAIKKALREALTLAEEGKIHGLLMISFSGEKSLTEIPEGDDVDVVANIFYASVADLAPGMLQSMQHAADNLVTPVAIRAMQNEQTAKVAAAGAEAPSKIILPH